MDDEVVDVEELEDEGVLVHSVRSSDCDTGANFVASASAGPRETTRRDVDRNIEGDPRGSSSVQIATGSQLFV